MCGRVPARALPILVVVVAAAWCAGAAADPLACQARATHADAPAPVEVSFQALVAGGSPPRSFFWDFGDGSTSTEQNPSHTYTEPGILQAVLTVTGAAPGEACKDTAVVTPGFAVDPVCLISAQPRWSEDPDPIQFTAGPGFVFDPPPYTWTWTFGDGTTSTESSPQHAYATPGTYWAAVTLHTADGSRAHACGTIRVTTFVPQVLAAGPMRVEAGLRLDPPRPSPFEAATTLAFALPRPGRVRLVIVDAGGRRIATLVDEVRSAGPHVAMWQGRARAGHTVPSGLYFAVLEHEGRTKAVRIAYLR